MLKASNTTIKKIVQKEEQKKTKESYFSDKYSTTIKTTKKTSIIESKSKIIQELLKNAEPIYNKLIKMENFKDHLNKTYTLCFALAFSEAIKLKEAFSKGALDHYIKRKTNSSYSNLLDFKKKLPVKFPFTAIHGGEPTSEIITNSLLFREHQSRIFEMLITSCKCLCKGFNLELTHLHEKLLDFFKTSLELMATPTKSQEKSNNNIIIVIVCLMKQTEWKKSAPQSHGLKISRIDQNNEVYYSICDADGGEFLIADSTENAKHLKTFLRSYFSKEFTGYESAYDCFSFYQIDPYISTVLAEVERLENVNKQNEDKENADVQITSSNKIKQKDTLDKTKTPLTFSTQSSPNVSSSSSTSTETSLTVKSAQKSVLPSQRR